MKKRSLVLVLLIIVFGQTFLSGCKKLPPPAEIDSNYPWTKNETNNQLYSDTSDLPSFSGPTLKLSAWDAHSDKLDRGRVTNNVVYDEIERVTGVRIEEDYKDNGQATGVAARFTMLNLGNELPQIAYGSAEMTDIITPENVWDLTEYIDKYAPNIKRRMPESIWNQPHVNGLEKGKVYGIPYNAGSMSPSKIDKDTTAEDKKRMVAVDYASESYGYFYVRDDILKRIYPTAMTQDEVDAKFIQNGKFTEEELFDVPIYSAEDFFKFAEKVAKDIDDNSLTANNLKVRTMVSTYGSDEDTWQLLGRFFPMLLGAPGQLNTMFSYWDADADKVKLMFTQPFFKNLMNRWATEIKKGYITSDYGFNVNRATLSDQMNSGAFAIAYGDLVPAGYQAIINGTPHKYRKVYMKIPMAQNFVQLEQAEAGSSSVILFKKTVREGDIPHILSFLDYQQSEYGESLISWGPRSAGLWEVTQSGNRKFIDADIQDNMVYSRVKMNDKVKNLNLSTGVADTLLPVFPFIYKNNGKIHPCVKYDKVANIAESKYYYTSFAVKPRETALIARIPSIHKITNYDIPGISDIWSKRPAVEETLKALLLSETKNSFTAMYSELEKTLRQSGWSDDYFEKDIDTWFKSVNAAYMSDLLNYTDSLKA